MEEKAKSYAREAAGWMLAFLAGLFLAGVFLPGTEAMAAAESLKTPIFTFSTAAFTLDKYLKQR